MSFKIKRHILLPLVLLIYGAVFVGIYANDYIQMGEAWRIWLWSAILIVNCILLHFALKRKQRLADQRNSREGGLLGNNK
ncbi:MAG: hypothetical protein K2I48_00155 [Muribaculaceae bacterium]|nr:hypothetical protein [Muribaculaceae bacterium]